MRLSGLRVMTCRPDKAFTPHPALVSPDATLARLIRPTVYALRCNNIDLIWPMARVGFSPFRTYTDAVHDAVTAEYAECIAQTVEVAVSSRYHGYRSGNDMPLTSLPGR
ncbi:hypothetical protein ACLB1E_28600 [Escherichia coli]